MPEPRLLIGRYEIGDLIGAGGSSRVHRGHDRLLDRVVAIKLLDAAAAASADPAAHERFLREARSSAGFSHRHSVATYDAGDDAGQLFLVMEFVDGPSLAHRIAAEAPMPEAEVIRVGGQVLDALGAAHANGLIHRDVKPANILFDTAGDAKLADFGIAKRFDELAESLTVAGMVIGTRDYLAPEQAAGAELGPQVDLYALGVVLYEMATGRRPGRSGSHDPRDVRDRLSASLAATITTALAPQPRDRYGSAGAMAAALTGDLPPTELSIVEPGRASGSPRTAAMPAAAAATAGGAASAATEQMADRPVRPQETATMSETRVMPAESGSPVSPARWLAVATAVLLAVIAVVVLANRDPDDGPASGEPTASSAATEPTIPATAATPPPTVPSTTSPPDPPATAAPTAPPVDELVPGFPATGDLDGFIDQLRDAKDVAGKQAKKLSDELRKIRDEDDAEKRDERIDDLDEKLEEWVEEGELEPAIAEAARQFLDRLD